MQNEAFPPRRTTLGTPHPNCSHRLHSLPFISPSSLAPPCALPLLVSSAGRLHHQPSPARAAPADRLHHPPPPAPPAYIRAGGGCTATRTTTTLELRIRRLRIEVEGELHGRRRRAPPSPGSSQLAPQSPPSYPGWPRDLAATETPVPVVLLPSFLAMAVLHPLRKSGQARCSASLLPKPEATSRSTAGGGEAGPGPAMASPSPASHLRPTSSSGRRRPFFPRQRRHSSPFPASNYVREPTTPRRCARGSTPPLEAVLLCATKASAYGSFQMRYGKLLETV
jgi:hypothetical protein